MSHGAAEFSGTVAIVPARNEEGRVGEVVRLLVSSNLLNQVIVVSDGSDDRTVSEAESAGAEVLSFSEHVGKAAAMARGVAATTAPVVCFFDADLVGLTVEHVRLIVEPVMRGEMAMNVGLCDRGHSANWLARHLPLVSGQRALRREVFESVPSHQMVGYGAEMALDQYCRSNRLPVGVVVLPKLSFVRKIQKIGLLAGLVQYVRMLLQLIVWLFVVRLTFHHSDSSKVGANADSVRK